MANALKIVRIGAAAGIVLPEEILTRLGVEIGDVLVPTEGPGTLTLRPLAADRVDVMAAADTLLREDRDILAALAEPRVD